MNNGWIKLHRKLLDNPSLHHDTSAYVVFTKLLLVVNRKTGKWSGGRFQLAELTGLKPTTAYAATARLSKAKMMTLSSNNKYTVISICKWAEYQGNGNSSDDNKMTTTRQQDDTLTRSKEVKKVSSKELTTRANNRDPQITQLISHFETSINKMSRPGQQVTAAIELIRDHGFERSIGAVNAVVASRSQKYAPSIANLEDLRDKWVKLENFWQRETKPRGVKIN